MDVIAYIIKPEVNPYTEKLEPPGTNFVLHYRLKVRDEGQLMSCNGEIVV